MAAIELNDLSVDHCVKVVVKVEKVKSHDRKELEKQDWLWTCCAVAPRCTRINKINK